MAEYSEDGKTLIKGDNIAHFVIPDSVTNIEKRAFAGCSELISIDIPDSVTNIGTAAFSGCKKLVSVDIPDSVTNIGNGAFHYCLGLESIKLSNSQTSIGDFFFHSCGSLNSIEIPASVMTIGKEAFNACSKLASFVVQEDNPIFISQGNVLFTKTNELISCPGGKHGVYKIPNWVNSIGNNAFYGCSRLTSIVIPNSVTSIGEGAFYLCNALTSIKIPDSITSIGNGAFAGCNAIVSIKIPNSVTSIGHSVFSYCSKLSVLEVEENNPNYYSKDNVLFSKTQQLLCCPVAKQGVYVIPNNVREICDHAFDACDELTSLYIPNSVVKVGYNDFFLGTKLRAIHLLNKDPNAIDIVSLWSEMLKDITLYVPVGTGDAYRQHPEFSKFKEVKVEHCTINYED